MRNSYELKVVVPPTDSRSDARISVGRFSSVVSAFRQPRPPAEFESAPAAAKRNASRRAKPRRADRGRAALPDRCPPGTGEDRSVHRGEGGLLLPLVERMRERGALLPQGRRVRV